MLPFDETLCTFILVLTWHPQRKRAGGGGEPLRDADGQTVTVLAGAAARGGDGAGAAQGQGQGQHWGAGETERSPPRQTWGAPAREVRSHATVMVGTLLAVT